MVIILILKLLCQKSIKEIEVVSILGKLRLEVSIFGAYKNKKTMNDTDGTFVFTFKSE